ncbi:hypothetical protein NM688_g1311 [Phlebia brevispora]|uniref:Uncharacterized protein n=1 Tax=Phlebia brevispora TaxID=194682 RepID=A0ACC1TBU5_9APHY|nr:hypothetical protein NM688_g1311 [Phlebia brevispora]
MPDNNAPIQESSQSGPVRGSSGAKINRLPEDVLLPIFLAVPDAVNAAARRFIYDLDETWLSSLRLAHTCSLWRNILFAYGEPWSKMTSELLDGNHVVLAEFVLERTRNVPLEVAGNFFADRLTNWQIQIIGKNMHRFRRLHLYLPPYNADIHIARLLDLKASEMRHCDVTVEWSSEGVQLIFPHLFSRSATKLDSYYLRQCRLEYTPENYQNLVSLRLFMVSLRRRVPNELDINVVIANSPRLESLRVSVHSSRDCDEDCDDWDPRSDPLPRLPLPQHRRYKLERLSVLELDVPLPYMLLTLGSIIFPDISVIESISLNTCRPSATTKKYFNPSEVLSQDYIPQRLLQNAYRWEFENCWLYPRVLPADPSLLQPELLFFVSCRGVQFPSDFASDRYDIAIGLGGVEDDTAARIAEVLPGFVPSHAIPVKPRHLHYEYSTSDRIPSTIDLSKHVKMGPILGLLPDIDTLDIAIDIANAVYSDEESPFCFSHRGYPENVKVLNVSYSRWSMPILRELARFCKNLPRLEELSVAATYAHFDKEDEFEEVARVVEELGLQWSRLPNLQLSMGLGGSRVVDLGIFLHNDEDYSHLDSIFEHVTFHR